MFVVENKNIDYLVDKEYKNACKYDKYHSNHEAFAVLKEEIEEVTWCIDNIEVQAQYLWTAVKQDLDEEFDDHLYNIKNGAYNGIKELLQVLAVIKKYENKGE